MEKAMWRLSATIRWSPLPKSIARIHSTIRRRQRNTALCCQRRWKTWSIRSSSSQTPIPKILICNWSYWRLNSTWHGWRISAISFTPSNAREKHWWPASGRRSWRLKTSSTQRSSITWMPHKDTSSINICTLPVWAGSRALIGLCRTIHQLALWALALSIMRHEPCLNSLSGRTKDRPISRSVNCRHQWTEALEYGILSARKHQFLQYLAVPWPVE